MRSLKFEKFLTLRNSKGISKKGQAAMEFLMTYGWAILVVLVAIGALAYFGVLSPGKFLPETCILTPGLACTDSNAVNTGAGGTGGAGKINLLIQNGMGESVDISSITAQAAGLTCDSQNPASIPAGAVSPAITITCTAGFPDAKEKLKVDIAATYTKGTSTLPHSFAGTLTATVGI